MDKELVIVPDFIIAGAMKSGTTTLHMLLADQPGIFIPPGEVNLLTIDEIEQFPQSFGGGGRDWCMQDFDLHFEIYRDWQAGLFAEAKPDQIIGEDSPTYLPSRRAIDRIAQLMPETKLVILLRDPVSRLISHYWHWVRSYRAIYSLADTLRFQHGNLFQRSYYEEQVRYCFERLSKERVYVVIFEDFIQNQERVLKEIFSFLDLDAEPVHGEQHANRGAYPKYLSLALLRNRLLRHLYGQKYVGTIPRLSFDQKLPLRVHISNKVFNSINPQVESTRTPVDTKTRQFLQEFLYEKNKGLCALLGQDLSIYWPTFEAQGERRETLKIY